MGSAAEITEPTTGTEKLHHHHHPVEEEEDDEQVLDLERKKSSFPHGKRPDSADSSTITTANNTSSSSSFSGDVIPDGEGHHISLENLEVPESPEEKETENGFHEEHDDGNNCNVYFDGEQGIWKCRHCDWTYRDESLLCFETKGSESAGDVHDSQTADRVNGEKKPSESENGSTFEGNKRSREIEEVHDGDFPKELDAVDQPAGVVIEEELEIGDVEDYDVEKVLDKQETHDLFCPNCNSCITKRVVLKRRKRKIPPVLEDPKRLRGPHQSDTLLHSEDNKPSTDDGENSRRESFVFKCLSCFSIFIPTGVGLKPLPSSEAVEGLKTQPKPQKEVTGDSNWFSSIFGFGKKDSAAQQGGPKPSVPEANPPRDNLNLSGENTTVSTVNTPSEVPAIVQHGAATSIQDESEISASQDKEPVDTPFIQVANSNDTSKVVNNGATVENGQKFLAPSAEEEQSQEKIDKDNASVADGNCPSEKGRLSPIHPSHGMSISNTVTRGPDGVKVETIIHPDGVSHLFEGTDSSETRKPDFSLPSVTDTGGRGVIAGLPRPGIDVPPLPVSSLEEGTLTEPLVRPIVEGSVVEGRKLEILKSIVYGGLIEAITSLGVISSAAGSGASMLNILVLGLANLFGGLILIIHNLQELREEEPRRTITEDNQTNSQVEEGRYKRVLGRRENFTLHASVAIISFIITGLIPPVVYYFSFSKTQNRDYKVASVFGASLLCIILLALAKAHVRSPRGSHMKSVMYYAMIAVSVSGISYVVGNFLDQLLEKYGWSDGTETPAGQMMLSLMGRKAGSFGYS